MVSRLYNESKDLEDNPPNHNLRVAGNRRRVARARQELRLEIDKLAQPGLLVPLRDIAPSGADEADVRDIRILSRLDELRGDLVLLRVRRRDQAERVGAGALQRAGHVLELPGGVADDRDAHAGQFPAVGVVGVQREPHDRVDGAGEVLVRPEQLGDQVAGVALGRCDTHAARHGGKYAVLIMDSEFGDTEIDMRKTISVYQDKAARVARSDSRAP